MFGYIQANLPDLAQDEKERYQAVYCGLCHALGSRYGFCSCLGLNYDLVFLNLLLSSLYEPEEKEGKGRCIVHPCRRRPYAMDIYTDFAADMTVALMYHKCLDDWTDEHKLMQRCYASLLSGAYRKVKQLRPAQCAVIEKELEAIAEIERSKNESPDAAANSFGRLMAGIFTVGHDHWEISLQRLGYFVGKYVYLADAAVDFEHDKKSGSYNPLSLVSVSPADMRPTLKAILGEASEIFESLPLVQDAGILRNILYSGIWIKYNQGMEKERKRLENGK